MVSELEMKVIVNERDDGTIIVGTHTYFHRDDMSVLTAASNHTVSPDFYNDEERSAIHSMIVNDITYFQRIIMDSVHTLCKGGKNEQA